MFTDNVVIMQPIPAKSDILADLHRLSIIIKQKHFSLIENMRIRYSHVLSKMIKKKPVAGSIIEVDEISNNLVKASHGSFSVVAKR